MESALDRLRGAGAVAKAKATMDALGPQYRDAFHKREDFGNARDIRTFFERILPAQAYRIAETPDFESMTNEELLTITAADIRAVAGW
jgi:hypothetical protein